MNTVHELTCVSYGGGELTIWLSWATTWRTLIMSISHVMVVVVDVDVWHVSTDISEQTSMPEMNL